MKKLYTQLFLVLIPFFAFNQASTGEVEPCHQVEHTDAMLEQMSEKERQAYYNSQAELEAFTKEYVKNQGKSDDETYIIPVVFHVIHTGGTENISDEAIYDCMRIINEDFNKRNADTISVKEEFEPIIGNTKTEFKLAKKAPDGSCTKGITRTHSWVTDGGSHDDRIDVVRDAHGDWPGDRYLNIFVARDIGGAAGYTNYPNDNFSSGTSMGNGIHVLHNYVGSFGESTERRGRIMTHEIGHWLNLRHTWGNSNVPECDGTATDTDDPCYGRNNCDQDDGVEDTPLTIGWRSCSVSGESCGDLDNIENYMEYAYCFKMFTEGQSERMRAALNSSVGGRSNVVSQSNLEFTGVLDKDRICEADFHSNINDVCTGEVVSFEDRSFRAPAEWEWSFQGGEPAESSEENPTVTYSEPGKYDVVLTVRDAEGGQATIEKKAFINVLPETIPLDFADGFEYYNDIHKSTWSLNDSEETFEITKEVAYTGKKSLMLNNFNMKRGLTSRLNSRKIDLSSVDDEEGVSLSFRYAYRKRNSEDEEWLRIFYSADCGESWALRRNLRGNQISDLMETNEWFPQSEGDWTTVHLTNITSQFWVENFRFRIEFESDGGNNFFLDDINIYHGDPQDEVILSTDEFEQRPLLAVHPNPTRGNFAVSFNQTYSSPVHIAVTNSLGQEVKSVDINSAQGHNTVYIDGNDLEKGVYFVNVSHKNGHIGLKKLVIK